ncbi:hypothetical protein CCP2SC5_330016 [Azospirillaceae bacterium]
MKKSEFLSMKEDQNSSSLLDILMNTGKIKIKEAASEDDIIMAGRMRYDIYIEKQGKRYTDANNELKLLIDDLDSQSCILFGYYNENIVATLRVSSGTNKNVLDHFNKYFNASKAVNVFGGDSVYFLSRLVSNLSPLTGKVTYRLFEYVYASLRMKGGRVVILHTVPSLVNYFKAIGFQQAWGEFVCSAAGVQIPMIMAFDNVERLCKIKSPLRRIASQFSHCEEAQKCIDREFIIF